LRNSVALLVLGAIILIAAIMAYANSGDEAPISSMHTSERGTPSEGVREPDAAEPPQGCEASVRATGSAALTSFVAQIKAHKAWKREVRAIYGSGFTWASARERGLECHRVGIAKRCTAWARPCRG
jgi:hypothetical protein